MALSEIDRVLLDSCLNHEPRSWENFVDRFLGLVVHVINHSGKSRSLRLNGQDREDLSAEVFLSILNDDYAVLRRFRGDSSLATYLTVIARRVVVRELLKRPATAPLQSEAHADASIRAEKRISDRDEVERLLHGLGRSRSPGGSHVSSGRPHLPGDRLADWHAQQQRRPHAQPRSRTYASHGPVDIVAERFDHRRRAF